MSLQDAPAEDQDDPAGEYEACTRQARAVRADVVEMTTTAGSGHPGSSFSSVDILVWLYNEVLRVDPEHPEDPTRDRLVFSKGHASPALYSVLARNGFFDRAKLRSLRETDAMLEGHASANIPGVEFSSGSLGQGLSFAVGTALNARLDGSDYRSFVVLGDGELQEGNVWEAAMCATQEGLDSLVAFVEYNGAQNDGLVAETKSLAPLREKFEAFGWAATECDGHDFAALEAACADALASDRPAVVVADTTKGKGVSFMEEAELGFHSTVLGPEQVVRAFEELGATHRLEEWEP